MPVEEEPPILHLAEPPDEDAPSPADLLIGLLDGTLSTVARHPVKVRAKVSPVAAMLGSIDVIVFELGDGILGTYGVDAILECPDIRAALTGVILSANDPVAAWGGVKLLRERFGVDPCVVTGPATDNAVGVDIIKSQMGVAAFNAMTDGAALGDRVIEAIGVKAGVAS